MWGDQQLEGGQLGPGGGLVRKTINWKINWLVLKFFRPYLDVGRCAADTDDVSDNDDDANDDANDDDDDDDDDVQLQGLLRGRNLSPNGSWISLLPLPRLDRLLCDLLAWRLIMQPGCEIAA